MYDPKNVAVSFNGIITRGFTRFDETDAELREILTPKKCTCGAAAVNTTHAYHCDLYDK